MAEPFLAEIRMVGFNFAPRRWALCDGQILPINQNQSLYSLLGTTYGGDGRTTFGLPELRGRVPIHTGSSNGGDAHTWGEKSGEETHTLVANEIPQHKHVQYASNDTVDEALPTDKISARSTVTDPQWAAPSNLVNMSRDLVANTGGGQAHNNMQPYLVVTFLIAIQGLFPSRN